MANKEHFTTVSPNGLLEAVRTIPDSQPVGTVLCLHGGPGGDLTGNTGIFDDLAEVGSRQGFATIQFSFFGSGGSAGSNRDISIKRHIEDYRHMLEVALSRFDCPLHVAGESAGGTIASQAWDERVKSYLMFWPAFDLSGSDLRDYLSDEMYSEAQKEGYVQDGSLTMSFELINELRTLDFRSAYEVPTDVDFFIAHGRRDTEVPYSQSMRVLDQANGRVHFFGHPNADHGFKDPVHRADLLVQLEGWLRVLAPSG